MTEFSSVEDGEFVQVIFVREAPLARKQKGLSNSGRQYCKDQISNHKD